MNARHDAYSGFAGHYDLHGWDWYAPTYSGRLFDLLEQRGIRPVRALDAGCGTGTMALAMAAKGWRVCGIDLSEPMLQIARRKDAAGRVAWRRADVTRFDLTDQTAGEAGFDFIVCVADTLNHLETLDEWEAAFRRFAGHLVPGGWLFFDAMTCRGLERLDKLTVLDLDDKTLVLAVVYEKSSRRSTVKVTSFVPAGEGGLYDKATETIAEWGQPVSGILQRLTRAGFADAERLWPTGSDPECEDRLAVLARRI